MVITLTENTGSCAMAEICPAKEKPIRFKIHVTKLNGEIYLLGGYKHSCISYSKFPLNCNEGGEGLIMLNDNLLITNIIIMWYGTTNSNQE